MNNLYALITGGSSGIGFEIARSLGKRGYNLILVSSNIDKLVAAKDRLTKEFNNISVKVIAKDLCLQESAKQVYELLITENIMIDILVNNAGFGTWGKFGTTDLDKELALVDVNIKALVHLTKLFIKDMLQRNEGMILNVGSTAGFFPIPEMANYAASKAFVNSFTEAIRYEHQNTNLKITLLCPSAVDTGFAQRAGMQSSRLFRKGNMLSAEFVAEKAIDGLFKNKFKVIPGRKQKLLLPFLNLLPRKFLLKFLHNSIR